MAEIYQLHFDEPGPHVFEGTVEQLRNTTGMAPELDLALLDELAGLAVDEEKQLAEGCLAKRVA